MRAASEYRRKLSPVLPIAFRMTVHVIGPFTYNCNNVVPEHALNYLFISYRVSQAYKLLI